MNNTLTPHFISKEKRTKKERRKEWASPMNLMIRFSKALALKHIGMGWW